jgi:methylamine---glutamate N-methyltransferase subunit A
MCGIAAILYKVDYGGVHPPVGAQLRDMLYSMRHRGVDSTGVTIAGQRIEADYVMRLTLPKGKSDQSLALQSVERAITEVNASVQTVKSVGEFCRFAFDYRGDLRALGDKILGIEGVQIHSIGRSSEVIKDVGDAMDLDKKHHISAMNGTHGVGHVRLATESEVDITHSHPFWAYPFPDITVVHNGQLTNYHKLKREFQQRGFRFQTHNDSEVIAVYIAEKLSRDEKLKDVLSESLDDLDGTFTYVVSTASGIGMAKDRWSAKPFVILETNEVVGVASEEVALRRVFSEDVQRFEPQEHEVLSWSCAPAPVIGSR